MATLRSLLALYGALDQALMRSGDNPEVVERVDQFLPGASENTGWYGEIENLFFSNDPDDLIGPDRSPQENVLHAVEDIVNENRTTPLTVPELSRFLYAITAVMHVPGVLPAELDGTSFLTDALRIVQPPAIREDRANTSRLVDFLADETVSWRNWDEVIKQAADLGLIFVDVSKPPLCAPSLVSTEGYLCVVIDTVVESEDVTLTNVKKVADALNWDTDYGSFFCDMQELPPPNPPDGWLRVLETVGVCSLDWSTKLRTALKYYKSTPTAWDARLDYDLNRPSPGFPKPGDGLVKVDKGFINMWSTSKDPDQNGVGVRTRKVVHISGVSPYAQAKLLCIFGYASAGAEMLFGAAKNPPTTATPWDYQPRPGAGSSQPAPSDSVHATVAQELTNYFQDLAAKNAELSQKWFAGTLTFGEIAKWSEYIHGKMFAEPWRVLQALDTRRGPGTSDTSQGGTT